MDEGHNELFKTDLVKRNLYIDFGEYCLEPSDIYEESMELTESICSEDSLRFGCCEASIFKFRAINTVLPMKGKTFTAKIYQGDMTEPFMIGRYTVQSDVPTADRKYRDIVAYDAMYEIINTNVSEWYNKTLPEGGKMTLKQLRTSFLEYMGVEQENAELINDDMSVERTIEPEELSGKAVITAICELNGCFGRIGRNGKFQYINLKRMIKGLYPSNTLFPSEDLYPADPQNTERIGKTYYTSCTYEDFETELIDKIQIRQQENDIGCIYGKGDNCYIIQDNFLVYGKGTEELYTIAEALYECIHNIWYRPAEVKAKGNLCLEPGDGIRISTRYEILYTYILRRKITGIQALMDSYEAEGEQYQEEKVNSVHNDIIQLKGKTNVLTRTIEETKSELTSVDEGLSSRITQNASSITLEVQRATETEGNLSSRITQNANSITLEVQRATETEGNLSSRITQNANSITLEVQRATETEGNLSSRITQNANSITLEVQRSTQAEERLQASINVNAEQISLRVQKNNIISEINQTAESVTIRASRIDLEGLVNAEELVSKFATVQTLNALSATVNSINADYASVGELNVQTLRVDNLQGRIDEISANYITASAVSARYATIDSVDAVDARIDTLFNHDIVAYGAVVIHGGLNVTESFKFKGRTVSIRAINGVNYLVASADES